MTEWKDNLLTLVMDPRVVVLAVVMLFATLLVGLLGATLLPVVIAFVIANFLDDGVERLRARGWARGRCCLVVYVPFLLVYVFSVLGPLPFAIRQALRLTQELPAILARLSELLSGGLSGLSLGGLEQWLPNSAGDLATLVSEQLGSGGQNVLGGFFTGLAGVTTVLIYLFLVPLLAFFFLSDKEEIRSGAIRLLPKNMELVKRVWEEMEQRMSNYIRGKVWEILIVAGVTLVAFWLLGFRYPVLMGIINGLSVIVPYVGALVVTVPVLLIGLSQWGFGWELGWLMIAYGLIQFVDGNILVPIIFSEAVKLSPTVILLAVLVFGTWWGLWGAFFAIPLATLAKALASTWIELREELDAPDAG